MLLWVLATNPARGFYEHLGGLYLREQPLTLGTTTLYEVAYAWPHLAAWVAQLQADPAG